jgi:hypothetical protein
MSPCPCVRVIQHGVVLRTTLRRKTGAASFVRVCAQYSIFLLPSTRQLFAYAEIESEERWASVAHTSVCQRWWKYMGDVMPSNPDSRRV